MSKTTFVRARMEPQLKIEAEKILDVLGITPTQAVHMLYKQVVLQRSWPFDLKIPNEETEKALHDSNARLGLVECTSIDDMFEKLGIKNC